MKPNDETIEAYKKMAKESSGADMKAQIQENLSRTCDKFAGNEDKLDRCLEYLTDCAREILGSKNGDVPDEVCFRICRDYFNDEIWKKEDEEQAERQKAIEEKQAKRKAAEAKKAELAKKKAEAASAKKKAAEARKAELARKKAEALAKKKAEEERKAAELKRMKEEAEREAKAAKEAEKAAAKAVPEQVDMFAMMGV